MTSAELLTDAFSRIRETVASTLDSMSPAQLEHQIVPEANPVGWLIWHLSRVQDDHIAEVAGAEQVWTAAGWSARFGLPFGDEATGWGQSSEEVAVVTVASPDLLTGYHDAVHAQTLSFLRTVTDAGLDTIVDERWDPPVSLGARLVSVISDDLQHAGQAAYLRGLILAG